MAPARLRRARPVDAVLLAELGRRDQWTCWLCQGAVDPDAPATSPWAGTADHVVPRSRGGRTEPDNLRLAHRRCNARRGSSLPELEWPAALDLLEAAPLWQTLARLVRRPGHVEVVAVAPTAHLGDQAARWVAGQAERFLAGRWQADVRATGAGGDGPWLVRLILTEEGGARGAGRARAPRRPGRSRRR